MSNEQKLREALRETLLFCETFSNRWDGETGAHPFDMVERARQALATTEPEPTGMPEVKPWDHPEPQTMRWSDLEIRWIQSYGEQCWKAGYKHGAWGDKPAVNQQLTTDPFDEREAFEKWLGIKPLTGLTREQMEAGRHQVFSTNNPFCPCDSKTFRKVSEWTEREFCRINGLEVKT